MRRARLSLGEDDDPGQRRLGLLEGEPGEGDAVRLLRGDGRHPGAGALRVPGYGPARGSGDSPRATDTGAEPRDTTRSAAAVLRPRSRHGEGEVRSSEARVLPGAGQARIDPVALQRPFASQVEEVLSKEEVPLHHKELVRRYFDSLGAAAGTGAGETR